jgi:mRNA-degrading endonuclease RelE of RelBE toxin-antitoxin system
VFAIRFSPSATQDLRQLRKYDQLRIIRAIELLLTDVPDQETRNRKRLKPNPMAEWELQVGASRVFYDIDTHPVL